jgi:prepilin-type N-terminal cleavage/methylation domain-containing protein
MRNRKSGFTLIEILLVVAAIGILAGIVILAINPNKQLGDTRNAQRRSDVTTILNAAYQYAIDNNGSVPAGVTDGTACGVATQEICKTGGTCTGLSDISVLTTNAKYLVSIPFDPTGATTNGAGYEIYKNTTTDRITVCAPDAEQSATISVTR